MGTLLVVLVFAPLAAAVVVLLAGDARPGLVRQISLVTTLGCLAIVWELATELERPNVRRARDASVASVVKPSFEVKYTWLSFSTFGEARSGGLQFRHGVDGV